MKRTQQWLAARVQRLTYALFIVGIISIGTAIFSFINVNEERPADTTIKGFTPDCMTWKNVTRTLEPPLKGTLITQALYDCTSLTQAHNTWCVFATGNAIQPTINCTDKRLESCAQEKIDKINEQYPTYYYNETVCARETLAREVPVEP